MGWNTAVRCRGKANMNRKVDGKVLWIIASTFGRLTLGQTLCYMLSMHFLMFIRLQGCGIISSFQVQEQRFSEGAGLTLVKKLRTNKTRDQTTLLDSRPRLLVILLCCLDTVTANLHMAMWISEQAGSELQGFTNKHTRKSLKPALVTISRKLGYR